MHKITKFIPATQALFVALIGIVTAWYGPLMNFVYRPVHHFVPQHHSWTSIHITPIITVSVGVLLMYLAYFLVLQKRLAYWLINGLLAVLIVINIGTARTPIITIVGVALLLWLITSERLYKVRSSGLRMRSSISFASMVVFFELIYGTVVLLILAHPGGNLPRAIFDTMHLMVGDAISESGYVQLRVLHETARLLLVLSGISAAVVIAGLFRPIRFAFTSEEPVRRAARQIIERYGTSSEDFLKIWPHDKHYYFSPTHQTVIAYGLAGRSAIILGTPVGIDDEKQNLLQDFVKFCSETGWQIVAIAIDQSDLELYQRAGVKNKLYVGDEAIISIEQFLSTTQRSKHFRYVKNRARREGLTVEFWDNPSVEQFDVLEKISLDWKSSGGRKEFGFFMSPFGRQYLGECVIAVVFQNGKPLAYANILPLFKSSTTSTIDHMRSVPGADAVTMHFLLSEIIERQHTWGQQYFSLGLSPLSEQSDQNTQITLLLRLAKRFGARFYAAEGLSQFKSKFEPSWQPQYVVYSGAAAGYLLALRDIDRISSIRARFISQTRLVSILLIVAAIIAYVVWP